MFECDCVCHSDTTKKHCDDLSCMPCCTKCKVCQKNITLGKMLTHLLDEHGIDEPPASQESIRKLTKAIQDLYEQ